MIEYSIIFFLKNNKSNNLVVLFFCRNSSEGRYHLWTSVTMGAMSMMAKETGVTVFLLNLGYDFYLQWPNIKK